MFAPSWVATWASHRNRNRRFLRTAAAPWPGTSEAASPAGPGSLTCGPVMRRPSRGAGRVGTDGGGQRGVAARHERRDSGFQLASLDEDVPSTALAAKPDIGAETVDLPLAATAGMGPAKANDVAEQQLQHRTGGHRPG